jgi:hypothetical protein
MLPTFTTSSRRHSAFTQLFADYHSDRRYATRPKSDVAFGRHLVRVDRLCQPRDLRTQRGEAEAVGTMGVLASSIVEERQRGLAGLMTRTLTLTTSSAPRSSFMQLS